MPLYELSSLHMRKPFLAANLRPCRLLPQGSQGAGPWNYVDVGGSWVSMAPRTSRVLGALGSCMG